MGGVLGNKWIQIAALVALMFFVYTRFVQPKLAK